MVGYPRHYSGVNRGARLYPKTDIGERPICIEWGFGNEFTSYYAEIALHFWELIATI
jgi:hypothetical protein